MIRHPPGTILHFVFDRYLLLPAGALIALVWANSGAESYFRFAYAASFWVNEVGMALFLGLVMQEIMDATLPGGALHTWRRWLLPMVAAAGGLVASTFAYLLYVDASYELVLEQGWPIATAVDIAAAYFVLKLIFARDSHAYPFALLAAIVTNACALIFIGLRSHVMEARPGAAALLVAAFGVAWVLRSVPVRSAWPYLVLCAPMSWLAFYWDGLHPALSLVPIVPFLPHQARGVDLLEDDEAPRSAVRRMEHEWAYLVQPIVFLFGLANGGVLLRGYGTASWAILTAALAGRPLGMLLAVRIATLAGLHLPDGLTWRELIVVAAASSVGFTLALFAATAVFPLGPLLTEAKIGALLTAAGVLLAIVLARLLRIGRFAH
jgi:NhaA family Na+:H+ antiporter